MRMPEETLAATKLRWRPVDQLLPHPSSMPTGCGTDFVAIGPGVATGERGGGIGTRLAALVHREIEAAGFVATLLHHALPEPAVDAVLVHAGLSAALDRMGGPAGGQAAVRDYAEQSNGCSE
jgi:hypothetical protein